jgi:hypothetical protein
MGSRDARIGPEDSGAHIKNWAVPYIDRRKSLALNLVNLPVSSAIGISLAPKRDTLNDTVNTLKGLGNSASAYSNRRGQLATCETSHWLDRGFPFVTSP